MGAILKDYELHEKAFDLMEKVFAGKADKGGAPYIDHCHRVMFNLIDADLDLENIALLHDVVEDSEVTLQDLRDMGFSERVVIAVGLLTHDSNESYEDYIKEAGR